MAILQRIGVALAGIVFALALVEGAARLFYAVADTPLRTAEFLAEKPLPYANSDYFSEIFLEEQSGFPTGISVPDDPDILLMHDSQGRYFSIVDGVRVTSNQPETFLRRVMLFGSSTVLGITVPNDKTIASYLQRILSDGGHSARVENYGVVSVRAYQERNLLKQIDIKPGDIIVFFDGASDIVHEGYYDTRGEFISQSQKGGGGKAVFLKSLENLGDYSSVIRLLSELYKTKTPSHLADETGLERTLESAAKGFVSVLEDAQAISTQARASFFHFLQPTLHSIASPSRYEGMVLANPYLVPPGSEIAFRAGQRIFLGELKRAMKKGLRTSDLSNLLDARGEGEEFYLDLVHVNEQANERIAKAIYSAIENDLSRAVSTQTRRAEKGMPRELLDLRPTSGHQDPRAD